MARTILSNITKAGTRAAFHQALETAPNIWQNHCMTVPSDTQTETYVWPGTLPSPREFLSGRSIQGIRDFTYDVANREYELTFLIDQNSMEDDRNNFMNSRIAEAAETWGTFKDKLFTGKLEDGDTATTTFDATAYFHATRTIGSSGTLDNIITTTSAATANDFVTAAEAKTSIQLALQTFANMEDDQGKRGYNAQAVKQIRVAAHPQYESGFVEFFESGLLSSSDNPWGKGIGVFDPLPYLTGTDIQAFISAVGSSRKPFIYQERTPLSIEVFNDSKDVALNHGVLVMCRQRFEFAYGDFRRCCQMTYT